MEKIFEAKGEIVTSGIHPAVGNTQIPLWADGSNVLFKDGSVKVGPQQSPLFTKPSSLLGNGLRTIDNEGTPAVIWGDKKNLWRGLDPPTAENVTGARAIFNALDSDAASWTGTAANMLDEATIVAPGSTGSLEFDSLGTAKFMIGQRDLAAGSTDFSDNTFSFWIYVDSAVWANLETGTALHIKLGSTLGGASDWFRWYIPKSTIVAANTWYLIELDTNTTPADSNGSPDLTDIKSVEFIVDGQSTMSLNDKAYFDQLALGGFYTGEDTDRWSIVQFGQSVLATNGVDRVQYLADITTGNFQNINAAGGDLADTFRCKILQKLGPYIIAFGTDNDNTEARWCTEDNVLVWTPLAGNSARDINLRDMNSDIKAVVEFGNSLLVLGHNRAHLFQFIGPPFFFGAQKIMDGIGAVGKNAVTEGGRLIYGFGPSGIWLTDGTVKEYIDGPDVHSFVYEGDNKYDKTRAELATVWEDSKDDEIYFSYPTIDGAGFTVSFNPKLRVWSMHDYWRTAASVGELWDSPILMDSDGNIWIQSEEGTGSSFEFSPLGLSDLLGIVAGYGEGGYGELGYGGETEID